MKNCSRHNDVVAELNAAAAFVNVRPVSSGRMKWNKKKPSTLSFWNGTNNNVTNAGGFGARFSFGNFFYLYFSFRSSIHSVVNGRLQLEERVE